MTELADDGVLQILDCLGIVGIDVVLENSKKKESKGIMSGISGMHSSMLFKVIGLGEVIFSHASELLDYIGELSFVAAKNGSSRTPPPTAKSSPKWKLESCPFGISA